MSFWPFKPLRDYAEVLSWKTDVLRAKSAEQRIAIRAVPRMEFEFDFQLSAEQFSRAQSMARAFGSDGFNLPLWGDFASIGVLNAGVSVIPVDTTIRDFRVGGQVALWESEDSYELATIDSVSSASVILTGPTSQSYASAIIVPVVSAHFATAFSVVRANGKDRLGSANFVSTDSVDLANSGSGDSYLGEPVITDRIRTLGGINEQFQREFDAIDNETGIISQIPIYDYATKTSFMNWQPWSRSDLWSLRQWLHYCRGRQRGFWLPSWNNDLQIADDIASADTTLVVQAVGYPDFETVRDIMVEDTSGNKTYLRVMSGAAGGGNTEILTLSGTAGIDLTIAQVRRISYLTYMRQNADRVEIQHYAPGKATVSVPVMEAPAP